MISAVAIAREKVVAFIGSFSPAVLLDKSTPTAAIVRRSAWRPRAPVFARRPRGIRSAGQLSAIARKLQGR
jgi:hypothetical protein